MDQVTDESTLSLDSTTRDFDGEDNKSGDIELGKDSETDADSFWEQQPPIAEIKVDSSYLENKTTSESCKKFQHILSVIVVVIIIAAVWGMVVIPQLCYFRLGICQNPSSTDNTEVIDLGSQNCSAIVYEGSQCTNYFGTCSKPLINLETNTTKENNIRLLFYVLDTRQLSDTCEQERSILNEFICQYAYQPCDDFNDIIIPSRNVCKHLRDSSCKTEWDLVASGEFGSTLPNCNELPETPLQPNCTDDDELITPSPAIDNGEDNIDDDGSGEDSTCNIVYPGEACSKYLNICPKSNEIIINSYDVSLETNIAILFSIFASLSVDQSCQDSQPFVEEFLCRVAFQPCDDKFVVHSPNQTTCKYIRDELCPQDWNQLQNQQFAAGLLPDCDLFSENSVSLTCETDPNSQSSPSPSPLPNEAINFTKQCNEDEGFYLYLVYDENSTYNDTCQARCNQYVFTESRTAALVDDIFILGSTLVGFIGAFAVLFLSVVRHERMLIFPSVYIVYLTLELMMLGIIVIIQYIDRRGLSCASDNLVISTFQNPTPFCTISGFILQYIIIAITYWWFIHVCSTFWKIMFPLHARRHDNKGKYIHVISVIFGLILPLISPLTSYFIDGFVIQRFPPLLCTGKNEAVIYVTLILPITIAIATGITFLIIIIHVIHQKQRLFKHRISKSYWLGLSTAEKKLLVIFVYYILLGILDIIAYTYAITVKESVGNAVEDNLQCESLRTDPDYVCDRDFTSIRLAGVFAIVTYILLGLFTLVNLLFAMNLNEIKIKFVRWFPNFGSETFRSRTLSTSVIDGPETPFAMKRKLTYTVSNSNANAAKELATIGRSGVYLHKTTNM